MLPMAHRTLAAFAATLALGAAASLCLAQQPGGLREKPAAPSTGGRTCACTDEGERPLGLELDISPLARLGESLAAAEHELADDRLAVHELGEATLGLREHAELLGQGALELQLGLGPALMNLDLLGSQLSASREPAWIDRELTRTPGWKPVTGKAFATIPPAPARGGQGQPADSVYRLARERLNQGRYGDAADLFGQIVKRWPDSKYAADALYWRAFALYRQGALKPALDALQDQRLRYPNAATHGDAEALSVRINGELARGGDETAAAAIAAQASEFELQAAQQAQQLGAMQQTIANATAGTHAAPRGKQPTGEIDPQSAALEQAAAALDQASAQLDVQSARLGAAVAKGVGEDRLPPQCAAQQDKQEMRIAALNALLQMDAEQAVPVLRDLLKRRDECSAPLRRKAVFVVSQKPSAETEDILLDAVRNDPDAGVRGQAVFWLSQVPGERSLKAIESVLATSRDPMVQERALFALSQHRSPEAAAALRRFAENPSAPLELREKAIFMLGSVSPTPENLAFLRDYYRKSDDPRVKERIIAAMISADDETSGRFLEEVALDPKQSLEVRKKALFIASQRGLMPVATLKRIYDSPIPKDMKEQVIFALGQRKDGIDELIELARHETNPGFRSKAIFWLGQSKDPRAVKVLQEILSQ